MQKQKFSAKIKALRFAGLKNAIHPLLLKVLTSRPPGNCGWTGNSRTAAIT